MSWLPGGRCAGRPKWASGGAVKRRGRAGFPARDLPGSRPRPSVARSPGYREKTGSRRGRFLWLSANPARVRDIGLRWKAVLREKARKKDRAPAWPLPGRWSDRRQGALEVCGFRPIPREFAISAFDGKLFFARKRGRKIERLLGLFLGGG